MSQSPARLARHDETPELRVFRGPDDVEPAAAQAPGGDAEAGLQSLEGRLRRVPASMGAFLLVLGVADMAIPFTPMVGTALVGFGCVNLCAHANALGRLDRWLARRAPRARGHIVVCTAEMLQLGEDFSARFRADMAARYGK